jgi:hypothetical protein
MAFNSNGLQVIGDMGSISTGAGSVKRLYGYSTNDTRAQVETDGYFDDLSTKLNTGDVLIIGFDVDGTEGVSFYMVTQSTGDIALTAFATDIAALSALGAPATVGTLGLSTGDTYSDSAVNTAVNAILTAIDARLTAIHTKVDAIIDAG